MELMAVEELLRSVSEHELTIQADSQYVINVFTEWLPGWRRRGMRTSSGKPAENQDIIMRISDLLDDRKVTWEWVRGHVGHDLNERADALAFHAAQRAKVLVETGAVPSAASDPPRLTRPSTG